MKYMLLFLETESNFQKRDQPDFAPAYWQKWMDYCNAVVEAGIMVSGEGLQPPHSATTVSVRDGKQLIHDGPFAESKELLGGFFVIEVPDLDTALHWAARSPSAEYASVEVRPVLPPEKD